MRFVPLSSAWKYAVAHVVSNILPKVIGICWCFFYLLPPTNNDNNERMFVASFSRLALFNSTIAYPIRSGSYVMIIYILRLHSEVYRRLLNRWCVMFLPCRRVILLWRRGDDGLSAEQHVDGRPSPITSFVITLLMRGTYKFPRLPLLVSTCART